MSILNCKGRLMVIDKPIVMGILNATPDSFYDNSRLSEKQDVAAKVIQMLQDGATVIDIGGQSTRPGSLRIDANEEAARVTGVIRTVHEQFPEVIISIDTYYASVAEAAVLAGASIVNDVSGGMMDPGMISMVSKLRVPFVCTHMRGSPDTMQNNTVYDDVVTEVLDFFIRQMEVCNRAGIHDVILDPGIGFGKSIQQNFELIRNLRVFRITGKPILLGVSRKGTIYKTLGVTPGEALNGTTVLNTAGLLNGADILRVHDVKEASEAIILTQQIKRPEQ